MLAPLPADLPAAVIALQHTSPDHQSHLAGVLDRRTALPVGPVVGGDPLLPGRVLVIPAAKHLLVGTDERLRLLDTGDLPPAHPSADLLLVSLAVALTDRVVAVVLTGRGHDASVGVQAVHAYGGTVMVQDQDSAEQPQHAHRGRGRRPRRHPAAPERDRRPAPQPRHPLITAHR